MSLYWRHWVLRFVIFAYFFSVRLFNVLFYRFILLIYSRQSSWYSRQMLVHIRFVRLQNIFYLRCVRTHVSCEKTIRLAVCMSRMDIDKMWEKCPFKQNRKNYLFGFVYIKTHSRHSSKVASSLFGVSFFLSFCRILYVRIFFSYTAICRQTLYIFRLNFDLCNVYAVVRSLSSFESFI